MNIGTVKHLAYILKCNTSEKELTSICSSLSDREFSFDDEFYRERREVKQIKESKFKTRILTPPKAKLKLIQTSIKSNILDAIDLPAYVQGGRRGRSNITNAALHLGNKFKFTTDIKGFFPSVTPTHVYKAFLRIGFNPEVARVLTILTTFRGGLPQGAPSSSHVANLAFLPIDEAVYAHCKSKGFVYSRFIDDITISSSVDFKEETIQIISVMKDAGFSISSRKTHYAHIIDVTGIATGNNGLKPNLQFFERLGRDVSEVSRSARLKYMEHVKGTKKKW